MSGIASGVTKVFSSIGTGVAKLGSAVKGVGASLFTGAAAGGSSILGGGLSSLFGSGTLGKMFSGATKVLGSTGASGMGAGMGTAVGQAATKGFGSFVPGAVDATTTGALAVADTATGLAPTGVSAATGGNSLLKGFGDFLSSDAGAGLIGGVGEGLMRQGELDAQAEEAQKGRDYSQKQVDDLRNSYELPANVLPGGAPMRPDPTRRPTPAVAYARGSRVDYDPKTGRIVTVPA